MKTIKIKRKPSQQGSEPILLFPKLNSVVDMNKFDSIPLQMVSRCRCKIIQFKVYPTSEWREFYKLKLQRLIIILPNLDKLDVEISWTVEAIPGLDTAEKRNPTGKSLLPLGEQTSSTRNH